MKKFLVIGNPIEHSLSPILHNYWIKKNGIDAVYEKQKLNEDQLGQLILQVKKKEINGINVTVPFKKAIIPFLDKLSIEAKSTQSVNTIYLEDNKVMGHNTDIVGFETSIKKSKYNFINKEVLILGAGGVVPSIIFALNQMKVSKIKISNRTKEKVENLKKLFENIEIIEWGEVPNFDVIINATSIGLKKEDNINLDFSLISKNKIFYDVIYNPKETNFLKTGQSLGNVTLNGKLMFIYQALSAFNIWHKFEPDVDENVIKLLD
ncbi:shikimate dehydrogenase [Candidatus Pelagibacter bacterium nBUS_27]|uniref:shikimate dehydrogenase n=1 Tax=Candidatus Pelagibacter bacterium nBUS_27 TaxID=3374188 RepID=UPI003EBCD7A1